MTDRGDEPLRIGTNNGSQIAAAALWKQESIFPAAVLSAVIVGDPRGRTPTMTAPTTADATAGEIAGQTHAGITDSPPVLLSALSIEPVFAFSDDDCEGLIRRATPARNARCCAFRAPRMPRSRPMQPWDWSPIEQDILRAIALRVRLLAPTQVARGWFRAEEAPEQSARTVIERLEGAALIARRVAEAHPIVELSRPLFSWKVGNPPPTDRELMKIAKLARERWHQDHVPIEILYATNRAVSLFGSFVDARHLRNCEATHDLHLTEVYLRYRDRFPRLAADWQGEAAFPKMGFEISRMKDPDAFLLDRRGTATRIIEFAGSYEMDHLQAFHEHCSGGAAEKLAHHGWADSPSPLSRLYLPAGTSYELW